MNFLSIFYNDPFVFSIFMLALLCFLITLKNWRH